MERQRQNPNLKEAQYAIEDALDLGVQTGAFSEAHSTTIAQSGSRPTKHDVGHAIISFPHYDEFGLRAEENKSLATSTASVSGPRSNTTELYYAKTQEETGSYSTPGFYNDTNPDSAVHVSREDGKGGTYTGRIGGKHLDRATAIVGRRAAKKVREAVKNRAISIGEELLEE